MVASAMVVSFISPWPLPLFSGADFSNGDHYYYDNHGIANERSYYYQRAGLLSKVREAPRYGWAFGYRGEIPRTREVIPDVTGGIVAFKGGPGIVYVDDMGLTDVLIARLPVADATDWRIGHFKRMIPQGYIESVREDKNLIKNASLNEFYEAIRAITTGPLFTVKRWKMIWQLNTGRLDYLIDEYAAVSAIES
jgi:arabinofuranosyltransferase